MPETLVGIWLAVRNRDEGGPILCDMCHDVLKSGEIYNERSIGEPVIICDFCLQRMVEARLLLIEAGD